MSTTDKHTDLTAQEDPKYADARFGRGPERIKVTFAGVEVAATGIAGLTVAAAVPAAAIFAGAAWLETNKYVTLALAVAVFFLTLAVITRRVVRLPEEVPPRRATESQPITEDQNTDTDADGDGADRSD